MSELRIENVPEETYAFNCYGCGKVLMLRYNGGELDGTRCCGYEYDLHSRGIDFVVRPDPTPAAPDQAEGPEENRGADVSRVTSRAEESVMDKGVFRYDTDKTRLGAPPVPWDPSHREIL